VSSARDHGMDPGETAANNVAALQDAIDSTYNAEGGGTVEIPRRSSVYSVDNASQIILRPNVLVKTTGGRAVLHMASEPASALSIFTHDPVNGSAGAGIEGLELRGPSYGTPVAASGFSYGVWVRDGAGVTVRGNR